SLSAESEFLIHRAFRKGHEQANSKLHAPKQSGGLFWKRGRPAREGVPLRNTMSKYFYIDTAGKIGRAFFIKFLQRTLQIVTYVL
ncbi:MAG: hypothetical protein IIZ62_05255, partial [Ruminococcus sp.]|nr:hypothetical protein [Ruminococcus sp.]